MNRKRIFKAEYIAVITAASLLFAPLSSLAVGGDDLISIQAPGEEGGSGSGTDGSGQGGSASKSPEQDARDAEDLQDIEDSRK